VENPGAREGYAVPTSYKTSVMLFVMSKVFDTTMRNQTHCNINKTQAPLQTTGGKDEPNIALMRTSQHRTKNVKTYIIGQSVGHHYTQTSTDNINKTQALPYDKWG